MSRRAAKTLVPLLVGLVAVLLGWFATGISFADEGVPAQPLPTSVRPLSDESAAPLPTITLTVAPPKGHGEHGCNSCAGDDRG